MSPRRPLISLVVAMARNRVIGRGNALPWRLPEDLKRFKALTMGKPILMGRRTYESIGKPLPGRTNIVLTRDRNWSAPGTHTVSSVAEAIERANDASELAVIGGAEVYRLVLPFADRIHLTQVEADVEGDTWFPAIDSAAWESRSEGRHPADERNAYAMEFLTLDRRDR
jgi:dihydrofolate reductase